MNALPAGLLLCAGFAAFARAEVTLQSGPARVALIELYTSEGCSSCPPAEKWLGELRTDPGLWRTFVPVAFHVNYWDHLGWRDRFASTAFTQREHAYAAAWGASTVYTPCFVRNGLEWRPSAARPPGEADAPAGILTLTWSPDNICQIEFTPPPGAAYGAGPIGVSAGLLGSDMVSSVRAGENRGRELRHEFVALRLESKRMTRDEAGRFRATIALPPPRDFTSGRLALVAWVTKGNELAPLQAGGGWIE